ncbi:S1C family serine protease [Aliikangiella maris]|uniref:Trypsin-like peptidase domain-containing protein n=2 Tax=Aliikangiella maris TaxID=3162458 RepID=A0ABV3MQN2_9GAMM
MQIINNLVFIIKSIFWGIFIGALILFFMPESKLPFNWQSVQGMWDFYQQHRIELQHQQADPHLQVEDISFADAVQKTYPSVVSITVFRPKRIRDNYHSDANSKILDLGVGFGSGIILENGYIVTNYHVIMNSDQISANFYDGRRRLVDLVGFDRTTDIAILKTDLPDLKPAKLANSGNVRVGDIVMAIGSPFGSNQSVSLGIVSAITGLPQMRIQTDAAINSGNSGGPLINSHGEIIGINQVSVNSRGGGQTGINYAIPIDKIKDIVNGIILDGRYKRNWLGITAGELTDLERSKYFPEVEEGKGVFVNKIELNSPADKAGIRYTDLIIEYNGEIINSLNDFYDLFYRTPIGATVEFVIIRDGKKFAVPVKLEEMQDT